MNRLKIVSHGEYYNKKKTLVYRYRVLGSDKDLELYQSMQGDYLVIDQDTGDPLYFTSNYAGERGVLVCNPETGKIYVDDSELRRAASIAKQFGGNFGEAYAKMYAESILGVETKPQNHSLAKQMNVTKGDPGTGELDKD